MPKPPHIIHGGSMDLWEMFSELVKTVVEAQNVELDIYISLNGIKIELVPLGEDLEDYDEM